MSLELSSETIKKLLALDVSEFTESKNGLTYLSWAYAVREVLKTECDFDYEVLMFEQPDGTLQPYTFDEKTGYMCFTTVTINGKTRPMWLPVMDNRNKAMFECTMFEVNKTIMRCLAKNLAMFGLGLYIYAGEDLPEETGENLLNKKPKALPEYKAPKSKEETSTKPMTKVSF